VVELVEKAICVLPLPFSKRSSKPFRTVHTVLTDNGIQFADLPSDRQGPTAASGGISPIMCRNFTSKRRLTKPNHPWTNDQVERMNRTIKEATVKRFLHNITTSFKPTGPPSSPPTTSPDNSKLVRASHPRI
jgi:hypothetical protein